MTGECSKFYQNDLSGRTYPVPPQAYFKNFPSLSLRRAVSYAPAATSARLLGDAHAGYGGTRITRRIGFPQTGHSGRKGIFGSGGEYNSKNHWFCRGLQIPCERGESLKKYSKEACEMQILIELSRNFAA